MSLETVITQDTLCPHCGKKYSISDDDLARGLINNMSTLQLARNTNYSQAHPFVQNRVMEGLNSPDAETAAACLSCINDDIQ